MDTNPEEKVSGHNRIVLWGGKSSGKTTFAVALIKDVQDANLNVYFADTETTNKVTDYLSWIYDQGIFPPATTVSDISSELNFDIALPDKSGVRREVRISIPDIAGEWYTNPATARELAVAHAPDISSFSSFDPYEEYLANCSGIICLIDPMTIAKPRQRASLTAALHRLRQTRAAQGHSHEQRIALCLNKMDHPRFSPFLDREAEFAHQLLGTTADEIERDFNIPGQLATEWFGTSSVGQVEHGGRIRTNTYVDYSVPFEDSEGRTMYRMRILEPMQIRPYGLRRPIEWILDN